MSGKGVSMGGYNEMGKIRRLGMFLTGSRFAVGRSLLYIVLARARAHSHVLDADRRSQSYISGKGRAT